MSSDSTKERITRLRVERGWSKAKLARKAELNASDISRIELGRMAAYPSQLEKLAKALGVSTAELQEPQHMAAVGGRSR